MEPATYKNIWVRWIHSTWEKEEEWRSDIRPNVLNNAVIDTALFVLDDGSCVFVPMDDLRNLLEGIEPSKNGSVGPFNVNPKKRTINGARVSMAVKRPKSG